MMKLFSFVFFIAAFTLTWQLFNCPSSVKSSVHGQLQSKLALLIEETIKAQDPKIDGFKLEQITTETLSETQVKARYKYSFVAHLENGETSNQILAGEAVLSKSLSESPVNDNWVVSEIKNTENKLEYKQGLLIDNTQTASADETKTEN